MTIYTTGLIAFITASVLLAPQPASAGDNHNHAAQPAAQQHSDSDHDDPDQDDSDHNDGNHQDTGHEAASVSLSPAQIRLAGIKTERLTPQRIDYQRYAPAEIKANGYRSYLAAPRVDSVVLQRHATLGDHVKQGQPLVTLFSETMADAQAQFLTSRAEWQRVQQLGRKTVGDQRYIRARADHQVSLSRLLAYGLERTAIDTLARQPASQLGQYTLTAAIGGAVLNDDFNQGQRVDAGTELMLLADESQLWVEARLPAYPSLALPAGSRASVEVAGRRYDAEVVQQAHTIDEQTRTRVVRLLVNNQAHQLHPGMFADVYFQFRSQQPQLTVTETALVRSADGDWQVFVEQQPGEFVAVEVERGQSFGDRHAIQGLAAGRRVVSQGAFFVASELAKGGFDPHNH